MMMNALLFYSDLINRQTGDNPNDMASNFYEYGDQSVFIHLGWAGKICILYILGGGSLEIELPKGGAYSFEDFVERGGGS